MVRKAPKGLWVRVCGSWVETNDVEASMQVFKMELGEWETAVTTFGTWFGTPVSSLGMLPFVINALAMPLDGARWGIALAAYSLFGVWWADILRESEQIMSNIAPGEALPKELKYHGFARALLPLSNYYGGKVGIAALAAWVATTIGGIGFMGGPGASMTRLYMSSWLTTEVIVVVMKDVFRRARPAVVLKKELRDVRRKYRQLQTGLQRMHTAYASFPSGDAAGGAAFAVSAFWISRNPMWLLCAPLSAFGRMYFHAHHLLDVSVGAGIGAVVTAGLHLAYKQGMTWQAFALFSAVDVGIILSVFASRKLYIKNDQVF